MISDDLKKVIEAALTDGIVTPTEREQIKRLAQKYGDDWDEVEIYLNAEIQKVELASSDVIKKRKSKTCPYCGAQIPELTEKCPECGGLITAEASDELKNILEELENALVNLKSGNDIARNKAIVEKYKRLANSRYEQNEKVQKLLAEIEIEKNNAEQNKRAAEILNEVNALVKELDSALIQMERYKSEDDTNQALQQAKGTAEAIIRKLETQYKNIPLAQEHIKKAKEKIRSISGYVYLKRNLLIIGICIVVVIGLFLLLTYKSKCEKCYIKTYEGLHDVNAPQCIKDALEANNFDLAIKYFDCYSTYTKIEDEHDAYYDTLSHLADKGLDYYLSSDNVIDATKYLQKIESLFNAKKYSSSVFEDFFAQRQLRILMHDFQYAMNANNYGEAIKMFDRYSSRHDVDEDYYQILDEIANKTVDYYMGQSQYDEAHKKLKSLKDIYNRKSTKRDFKKYEKLFEDKTEKVYAKEFAVAKSEKDFESLQRIFSKYTNWKKIDERYRQVLSEISEFVVDTCLQEEKFELAQRTIDNFKAAYSRKQDTTMHNFYQTLFDEMFFKIYSSEIDAAMRQDNYDGAITCFESYVKTHEYFPDYVDHIKKITEKAAAYYLSKKDFFNAKSAVKKISVIHHKKNSSDNLAYFQGQIEKIENEEFGYYLENDLNVAFKFAYVKMDDIKSKPIWQAKDIPADSVSKVNAGWNQEVAVYNARLRKVYDKAMSVKNNELASKCRENFLPTFVVKEIKDHWFSSKKDVTFEKKGYSVY